MATATGLPLSGRQHRGGSVRARPAAGSAPSWTRTWTATRSDAAGRRYRAAEGPDRARRRARAGPAQGPRHRARAAPASAGGRPGTGAPPGGTCRPPAVRARPRGVRAASVTGDRQGRWPWSTTCRRRPVLTARTRRLPPARARRAGSATGAGGPGRPRQEPGRPAGVELGQELRAALGLVGLADGLGGTAQAVEGAEEAGVLRVGPADVAGAPPAVGPQAVEAPVVADPVGGVGLDPSRAPSPSAAHACRQRGWSATTAATARRRSSSSGRSAAARSRSSASAGSGSSTVSGGPLADRFTGCVMVGAYECGGAPPSTTRGARSRTLTTRGIDLRRSALRGVRPGQQPGPGGHRLPDPGPARRPPGREDDDPGRSCSATLLLLVLFVYVERDNIQECTQTCECVGRRDGRRAARLRPGHDLSQQPRRRPGGAPWRPPPPGG